MTSNFLNNDGAKKGSRRSGKRPAKKVKSRSVRRRRTPSKARVVAGRRRSASRRRSSGKVRKSVSRRRKVSSGPRRRRSASRRSRRSRPRMTEAQKSARRAALNKRALQNCTKYGMLSEECWKSLMPLSSQAKSNIRDIVRRIKTERSYERPTRFEPVPRLQSMNLPKLPDVVNLIKREVVDSNDIILENPDLKAVLNSYIQKVLRIDRNSDLAKELYSSSNPAIKLLSKLSDDLRTYLRSSDSTENKKAKLLDFLEKLGGSGIVAAGSSFKACGEAEILYHLELLVSSDKAKTDVKERLLDERTQVFTLNKIQKVYDHLKKDIKSCSFDMSLSEFINLINIKTDYTVEDDTHFTISKFLYNATRKYDSTAKKLTNNLDTSTAICKQLSTTLRIGGYEPSIKFLNTLGSLFSQDIVNTFANFGDVDNFDYANPDKGNVALPTGMVVKFIKENRDLILSKAVDSIFECSVGEVLRKAGDIAEYKENFSGVFTQAQVDKLYQDLKASLKNCTMFAQDKFETELRSRGFSIQKDYITKFLEVLSGDVTKFKATLEKLGKTATEANDLTKGVTDVKLVTGEAAKIYHSLPIALSKTLTEDAYKAAGGPSALDSAKVLNYIGELKNTIKEISDKYVSFCTCNEIKTQMEKLFPHKIITYSVLNSFLSLLRGVKLDCKISDSVDNIILEKCIEGDFKIYDFDSLKKKYESGDDKELKAFIDSTIIPEAGGVSFDINSRKFGNKQIELLGEFEKHMTPEQRVYLIQFFGELSAEQLSDILLQKAGGDPNKVEQMLKDKFSMANTGGKTWREVISLNKAIFLGLGTAVVGLGVAYYITGGNLTDLGAYATALKLAKEKGLSFYNWSTKGLSDWWNTNYNKFDLSSLKNTVYNYVSPWSSYLGLAGSAAPSVVSSLAAPPVASSLAGSAVPKQPMSPALNWLEDANRIAEAKKASETSPLLRGSGGSGGSWLNPLNYFGY